MLSKQASSRNKPTSEEVTSPPHIEHEWEMPGWIPDKPPGCEYGFVTDGNVIGCSQEDLISKISKQGISDVNFVWTPETPQPVFPEKVPLLVKAFKKNAAKEARKEVYWGAGLLMFGLILALAFGDWQFLYRNLFSVFGAVALIGGLWALYRIRDYTQEDAESAASSARFAEWIKSESVTGYTISIAACIIVVVVSQLITGEEESIKAVGLVKRDVWEGQWWRLFTGTLMHVNLTHFWINLVALLQFARIIERTIHSAFMPIIFLLSAICGSVFSMILYPNTTSVGASGGLMGLLGFTTAAVFLDRQKYPPKYLRRLIEGIIFVALLGVVGFALIDNGAHLGGLCGGLILGWIFLRRVTAGDRGMLKANLPLLGIVSLVLIGLTALAAIWQMFSRTG